MIAIVEIEAVHHARVRIIVLQHVEQALAAVVVGQTGIGLVAEEFVGFEPPVREFLVPDVLYRRQRTVTISSKARTAMALASSSVAFSGRR